MATTKHILVALVEDKPGVLNRIASLFRRRGFNIESITVGSTEEAKVSRMTIVVDGATTAVEQVRKQLEKVIEVIKVADITHDQTVARELALVKVKATAQTRSEIIQIVDIFRGKSHSRQEDRDEDFGSGQSQRGGSEGSGTGPPQRCVGIDISARKVSGLPGKGSSPKRALSRRRRFGRMIGQAGSRPPFSGHFTPEGENPECRKSQIR